MPQPETQSPNKNPARDYRQSLAALACVAALAVGAVGCRTAAMIQPDALSYPRAAESGQAVEAAIIRGARRAGWKAEAVDPGASTIQLRFMVQPDVFAIVQVDYAGGRVSFRYVDSNRFKCDPAPDGCKTIHKSYNARLLQLRERISEALSEPGTQPLDVPRALSIVRQLIEEQPRRSAYTGVDLTEERISAVREVLEPVYQTGPYFDNWGFYPYYGYYPYRGFYPGWSFGSNTAYVSAPYADVVYFNNIGRIELLADDEWQIIRIWDRFGGLRIRLYTLDEWLAKRFVDAVGALEQARLEADSDSAGPEPQ